MKPFSREILEAYLREDLAELARPERHEMDGVLMADLRFLYKMYGRTFKEQQDWMPVRAKE